MDPFTIATGVAGLVSLAQQVVAKGWATWKLIKTAKDYRKEISDLLMEINGLCGVLVALTSVIDRLPDNGEAGRKHVTESLQISNCRNALEQVLDSLQKCNPNDQNQLKNLKKSTLWPLTKSDTVGLITCFERHKSTFILALSGDTITNVIDILNQVEISNSHLTNVRDEQKRVAEEKTNEDRKTKREKSLHWLFPGDPEEKHKDIRKKRHEGTGKWFFEKKEFKDWLREPGSWLFCHGKAGAGKTVFMSGVLDYIANKSPGEDIGIAHIYFGFKDQDYQTPEKTLTSILRQLSYRKSELPTEVESLYESWANEGKTPGLRELVDALISVARSFSRVWLFFDGLDQCDKTKQRVDLLSTIRRLMKTNISGFATGRPYAEDIQSTFKDAKKIEVLASKKDIESFVRWKISPSCDKKLVERIAPAISKKAHGMFLLAEFQVDHILKQTNGRKMLQALDTIPGDIYCTYTEALERIHSLDKDRKKLALDVLAWVFNAARPLRPKELREAVAVEENDTTIEDYFLTDESTLIDICSGLVMIDENSQTVRFVNHTVHEYFEKNPNILQGAHAMISKTCLTYLCFDVFQAAPGSGISLNFLVRRIKENALYEYAARNWGYHTKFCQDDNSVLESVRKFSKSSNRMESALHVFFTEAWRISEATHHGSAPLTHSRSLLSVAAELGSPHLMQFLVQLDGLEVDRTDENDGRTPLNRAAYLGHTEIVRLLVARGDVKKNSKDRNGSTPLAVAAYKGHEEVVQLLLKRDDVDADSKDNRGRTPLSIAASRGHDAVVRLLLERNDVDADSKDKFGKTPLSRAISEGHEKVVRLLLESMEGDWKETYGKTILGQAAFEGHGNVVQLLVEGYGVETDAEDEHGKTPLGRAASEGHEEVVRFLLERSDVNPDSKDNDGITPLSMAAFKGHVEVVQLLLERDGVDANSKDNRGRTPLSKAASKGHEMVVRLLLGRNDIDADPKDRYGRTPLRWAAYLGYPKIVRLLVDRGDVDIYSKGNDGKTALDLCLAPLEWAPNVEKGAMEAVTRLLKEKAASVESKREKKHDNKQK